MASEWDEYRHYHYLNTSRNALKGAAGGFVALWEDAPVAMAITRFNTAQNTGVMSVSRIVVKPDYQGLGIAIAFLDALGEFYDNQGKRLVIVTSLPGFAQGLKKRWKTIEKARRLRPHTRPYYRSTYRSVRKGAFEYPGKSRRNAMNRQRMKLGRTKI